MIQVSYVVATHYTYKISYWFYFSDGLPLNHEGIQHGEIKG